MENLSDIEKLYFMMMRSKSGVLYLTSAPGMGKTSIINSIGKKLNYHVEDIILSSKDEIDMGLYPMLSKVSDVDVVSFAVPLWALRANERPTILFFDELNRSTLGVRNACLQILLERKIGEFKFNDNVLMVCAGNLGRKDKTEVDTFDSALNNRLIHYHHELPFHIWYEYFAKDNIVPEITEYLSENLEYYSCEPDDKYSQYANPRSWTFLSNFILNNSLDLSNQNDLNILVRVIPSYIGSASHSFIRFLKLRFNITLDDILYRYDEYVDVISKMSRDMNSKFITQFKKLDYHSVSIPMQENFCRYLENVDDDELAGLLYHILSHKDSDVPKHYAYIINKFAHFAEKILR